MISLHILASQANHAGGADVYTRELAMRLVARGVRTTLVCFDADAEVRARCDTRLVERGGTNEWPVLWRLSPILQLVSVKRSMARLQLESPNIVLGMAHQLIWAHARLFGARPLVYLPHSMVAPVEVASYRWGSSLKRSAATFLWDRLECQSINRARRTVRFTRAGCAAVEKYYGRRIHPRFEVIPPAVELPPRTSPRPLSGHVRLLSVGRLVASKNVGFLINVLGNLRSTQWVLDILGDGEERPALEAAVETRELKDRVIFHGHVPPEPFYARADLLVTASKLESAGLVILEAMSYGVPTLAIRPDGINYLNANDELIDNGGNGFLARNEADFALELERLIGSRARLEEAGSRARATVEKSHSWSAHLDTYERMLNDVMREGDHS